MDANANSATPNVSFFMRHLICYRGTINSRSLFCPLDPDQADILPISRETAVVGSELGGIATS